MSRRLRGAHGALATGIAMLAAACGDAPPTAPDPDPDPTPTPPPVASVAVTPGTASVEIAAQVQLAASTLDSAGQPLAGRAVAWSSSDPGVGSVDSTGLVTGLARGSVYIKASSEGQADSALVGVLIPAEVFVGAGDIADCTTPDDSLTADLLDGIAGTVFTLGDNAYEDGTVAEFTNCYDPTWGRHKARTFPSIGNHDYKTSNGQPYFDYFGANAGDPGLGYYSYVLGAWKIIVLNSNDTKVGVGPG
ncbi:MAG: Ig-like domain-containing protein, partial [Gemmatimonadota bacterium]